MGNKNFVFKIYPLDKNLSKRWCIDFYYEGKHGVSTRGKRFVSEKYKTLEEKELKVSRIISEIEAGYKPKIIEAVENANTHIQRLKNSLAVKLVKDKVNTFAIKTQFRHKSFKTTEEYLKSLNVSDFPELDNFSFF